MVRELNRIDKGQKPTATNEKINKNLQGDIGIGSQISTIEHVNKSTQRLEVDDLEKSRRWRRTDQSAAEERSRSRQEEKAKNAVLQRLISQKGEGRGSS